MIIENEQQLSILREAGKISVSILNELGKNLKVGVTPLEIDNLAGDLCIENKVHPSFRRVDGWNNNCCISVNDVAVHGIPNSVSLKNGDLVSIDFGIVYKKLYTDHCWTWCIGEPTSEQTKLLDAGRRAVENAIPFAVTGNRTGDLGYIMRNEARKDGFTTLSMFCGHGIGKNLHGDPEILAYGKRGTGDLLEDGMEICIECQVVDDVDDVIIDKDGWTARTKHGGNSVMFEYMVVVGDKEPEVITNTFDWRVSV